MTTDEKLAEAQQRVYRSRARFERAKQRLERDLKRRNDLDPVARGYATVKRIHDAFQTLTEETAPEPTPTLDSDPRTPTEQGHDFFNRPGDFYQVQLVIRLDDSEFGEKLGAQFMVKADDTQFPYLLEVLRQLLGALGGSTRVRLTLTKAQIAPADGPPMMPGVDFTLGDRFPPMPVGTSNPDGPDLRMGDLVDQVDEIAEQQGVKPEQIQVIPMRGGGYAYTVQPEPSAPAGRHARPDDGPRSGENWEHCGCSLCLAAHDDQDDDEPWVPCGRSGPCWKADGHEGDCTR